MHTHIQPWLHIRMHISKQHAHRKRHTRTIPHRSVWGIKEFEVVIGLGGRVCATRLCVRACFLNVGLYKHGQTNRTAGILVRKISLASKLYLSTTRLGTCYARLPVWDGTDSNDKTYERTFLGGAVEVHRREPCCTDVHLHDMHTPPSVVYLQHQVLFVGKARTMTECRFYCSALLKNRRLRE